MKKLILLSFLTFSLSAVAQKQIYEAENLTEIISKHKNVAILPFPTTITSTIPNSE